MSIFFNAASLDKAIVIYHKQDVISDQIKAILKTFLNQHFFLIIFLNVNHISHIIINHSENILCVFVDFTLSLMCSIVKCQTASLYFHTEKKIICCCFFSTAMEQNVCVKYN